MIKNKHNWLRIIIVILLTGLAIFLLFGLAKERLDPFFSYRDFIKKPLSIKPQELKHYAQEEALIRQKLALDISFKERAILSGLHWILKLVDKDDNFYAIFPDFMLLMRTLSHSHNRVHQHQVLQAIIKRSFARAQPVLSTIFDSDDEDSRFEFIRLLVYLEHYPQFKESYVAFYKSRFKKSLRDAYQGNGISFAKAIKDNNFQAIFAYLVHTSFLHYINPQHDLPVPKDDFPKIIEQFSSFTYKDYPLSAREFRELGYLATHVILAMTNYGEYPLSRDAAHDTFTYLINTLDKAKKLGDFDLYAEYLQCLIIHDPHSQKIKAYDTFLYGLQRPDGSWGSKRDFTTSAYTAIHPTGAALMALNQSP